MLLERADSNKMPKQISIKLKKIQYGGNSIGQNIRIETQISGQAFTLDQTIKHGTTADIDREIASFPVDAPVLEAPTDVKVIEKDFLFNDVGSSSPNLRIDTQITEPQEFNIEVRVRERRKIFRKSTAVFTVILQAQVFEQSNITLRQYHSLSPKQNYNRFDQEIIQAVARWNDEFVKQKDPPPVPLDPNLVKAMVYIESVMGYYHQRRKDAYPAFPDVMQFANPKDKAIHVFHDDGSEPTEYEINDGKPERLYIPEANASTASDSIKWGIRWLYHKIQLNINEGSQWRRDWRTWFEAVERYNGRKNYLDNVKQVYEKGFDPRARYNLWSIAGLFLLVSGLMFLMSDSEQILGQSSESWPVPHAASVKRILNKPGSAIDCEALGNKWRVFEIFKPCANLANWQNEHNLKKMILEAYNAEELQEIQDIEIKFYDESFFLAIVAWETDWWENLRFGRFQDGTIKWLEIENPPTEQSILSARFVELKGFHDPILEVYGETHMGNGDLYLYKINGSKVTLLQDIKGAVDGYYDGIWNPDNYSKYGYGTCGEVYEGDKLLASYKDLNNDGLSDIVLTGITDIICEQEKINEVGERSKVKVSAIPAKFTYYISNSNENE